MHLHHPTDVTTWFVPLLVILYARALKSPVHRLRMACEVTSFRGGDSGFHSSGDHMLGRFPSSLCTISTILSTPNERRRFHC